MATLVTVHGTFAHMNEGLQPDGRVLEDHLWWHKDSTFERTMLASLGARPDGQPVKITPFIWNGLNSERDRRAAGAKLLERLLELESQGEAYCVVGHSHGGSVVAAAMLMAASRKLTLPGLKQWITVGTPFIGMRPMPRLIDRLNLIQRVVLVASMMLLMMFLFFVAGQLLDTTLGIHVSFGEGVGGTVVWRTVIAALMMSLPALFFTILFRIIDRKSLFFYRKSTIARAREQFGSRWQSFCHASDEAVQGLRSLPGAKIQLFDPGFATQALTVIAVFAMPLAYVTLLFWPSMMVRIADVLKTQVYQVEKYADVEKSFNTERSVYRGAAKAIRPSNLPPEVQAPGIDRTDVLKMREALKQRYPNYVAIERALRFKREFFESKGTPCDGGKLCAGGRDITINSQLLFHVVTDDLTSALVNDDTRFGNYAAAVRAAIPMVLVPLAFVALALLAMVIIGWFARVTSALLARLLNRTTLSEIKREIYGNDTGTEVAFGVEPRPGWMDTRRSYLPPGIADKLTDHANHAAASSLAKFRNAISEIAMSAGKPPSGGIVSSYLTWKELIHSTYFDYPEFQSLVACAVSKADGFQPTPAFRGDPSYAEAEGWLVAITVVADVPELKTVPVDGKPVVFGVVDKRAMARS